LIWCEDAAAASTVGLPMDSTFKSASQNLRPTLPYKQEVPAIALATLLLRTNATKIGVVST
jgi:hypothetical protein